MSDITALTELSEYVAVSPLASKDSVKRHAAMTALKNSFTPPQPVHKKVADLLGVVMVLSARTRRMVVPRVDIELDVFSPGNRRAAKIYFGSENA